jgi:serine/threonine protein phosphatase PrpC
MLKVELAMLNEPGGREVNEDACGYWNGDDRLCCVVADGAGGHGGGREAAQLAVQHVLQAFAAQPSRDSGELAALLRDANRHLRSARVEGTPLATMFSTVACLVIDLMQRRSYWAHAGDTRIYWFRAGRVAACTKDHSVVQSMADLGLLPASELRGHPRRSELLCALGSEEDDLKIGEGELSDVAPGQDVFLLCTDGVWEHVEDTELESTLAAAQSSDSWLHDVEAIVRRCADAKPNHDNFSALAARVLEHAGAGA